MTQKRKISAIGIIPARYGSTRLPAKVLQQIGGKPLLQHVYESARAAKSLESLLVATDDQRIVDAVAAFGGRAVMTSPAHQSGSDRLAEAAAGIECDIVVNIQGDEPLIRGEAIDALVAALAGAPSLNVATLAVAITDRNYVEDPNVVKVVRDLAGNALYFSRACIPYVRDTGSGTAPSLKHIGIYAYRKAFLMRFTRWKQTELEKTEKLEQLRILEHGVPIRVVKTVHDSVSVDTAEDLERVRKLYEKR